MIDPLQIHAYVDGHMSPDERRSFETALAGDPAAQREVQSLTTLKSLLQNRCETPDSPELWAKCRGRFDELDKARRVESFVGKYAWGICGAFFVMIAAAGLYQRGHIGHVGTNEVSSYVAGMSPIPVSRSQNQTDVEPKLKEVIGRAFASRPNRMVITGVGENRIPGQRAQFVQLADEFGRVAVLAMPDVRQVDGLTVYQSDERFGCSMVEGVNALFWKREDGVICMVVGNRSYDELHSIIQAMGIATRP